MAASSALAVVAPQAIVLPAVIDAAAAQPITLHVLAGPDGTWTARSSAAWFTPSATTQVEHGLGSFSCTCSSNSGEARVADVSIVTSSGSAVMVAVRQAGGITVAQQTDLSVGAPLVMEIAIALNYIAQQIVKLPPPAQPIAIAIVEALIPVLGELLFAGRALWTAVPLEDPVLESTQAPPDVPVTQTAILAQVAQFEARFPLWVAEAE